MEPTYRYRAACERVIDGDTFLMDVDLGMRVHHVVPVRVRGFSAPELNTTAGIVARAHATIVLPPGASVILETYKDRQSFARWIADMWVDGVPIVTLLQPRQEAP